jgi:hypothetical protein
LDPFSLPEQALYLLPGINNNRFQEGLVFQKRGAAVFDYPVKVKIGIGLLETGGHRQGMDHIPEGSQFNDQDPFDPLGFNEAARLVVRP